MAQFLPFGSQIFGCEEKQLGSVAAQVLPELEKAKISSAQFWERVCALMREKGYGNQVEPWKFKGFWEGLLTDSLTVDDRMIDLIRRLKSYARVAVLSNVIEDHAKILQKEKVYNHFNPVVLSCNVGLRKPDKEMYQKAAELVKTKPDRCLLIDDCEENLVAAEKFGYRVYHYQDLDSLKKELHILGFLDHA